MGGDRGNRGKSGSLRLHGDWGHHREAKRHGEGRGTDMDCCRHRRRTVYISLLGATALLHVIAWNSREFCDWYRKHIFGIWVDTYGRAVGMAPFSVGECLIALGVVLGTAGMLSGAAWLLGRRAAPWHEGWLGGFVRSYWRMGAWILLGSFMLMTLNCYILYHGSGFSGEYLGAEGRDYTLAELAALRDFVAEQCNALCGQVPRREDGTVFYEGDMIGTAKAAMAQLGERYDGLSGFYPNPKPLRSSDFMSQQYVAGCFFPFSMEANYNDVMYVMNLPSTLCHELGHLKGYILEDEANLIAYLACVQSEDIVFRYSGYLSVLYYVDEDFRQAVEECGGEWPGRAGELSAEEESAGEMPGFPAQRDSWAQILSQVEILPQVREDNVFLKGEERARIEREALWDTEAVDAISDSIADASLKLNGVGDGMASYSRVVELLLRYYDIYGYP